MSQLQVTGAAKIRDIQGPVVSNSGVITALDGDASQYVRGDGTLADFPTSTGGGSSVSYYLNSSVSQGTIGGVAYRQLGKTPISGAGTDIAISSNGYVASYITDANDPALLEVPAGNFNCEFYFSVNSNAHNPYVYAELYKYDGTTFTLLGSSQSIPEYLSNGSTLSAYYFAVPVATAALTITDRLAIRIYVNVDGRTVTLHTENNHLCQVVTTFSKGLISLNNLTRQNQFFATGTSGTDFGISSSVATHTFNLPVASAANTGKLSSTDWSTFNNKASTADLANYLPLIGGTLTGNLYGTFIFANNQYTVTKNSVGGSTAFYGLQQAAGTNRWNIAITDIETGSNVGFNFNIDRYNDSGVILGTALLINRSTGNAIFSNNVTASSLIKSGGTSSQFLKANGSVDSNTYLTTSSASSTYVPYTGATADVALGLFSMSLTNLNVNSIFPNNNNAQDIGSSGGNQFRNIYANSFIKTSGTSAQFLKADGSVDTNAYITLTSLSAGAGISYNNTTGVIASTITQYTNALARAAVSLTTTGTSGAATYNSTTGVFNVPQYQGALTNPITGTGTAGTIPVFTATGVIGNSTITEVEGSVYINNYLIANEAEFRGNSSFRTTGNSIGNSIQVSLGTTAGSTMYGIISSTIVDNVASQFKGRLDFQVRSGNNSFVTPLSLAHTGAATFSSSVGVGVTPSAWSTIVPMQILNTSYGASPNNLISYMSSNVFFDGAFKYITTGTATQYRMNDSGTFSWLQANSGTAGNPITFTTAMTITSGGNVGIGTISPTTKIEVNGSGTANSIMTYPCAKFYGGGSGGINIGTDGTYAMIATDSSGADMQLLTRVAGVFYPRMTITSAGNVGIGTSSPSGIGTGYVTLDIEGTNGSGIKLGNGTPKAYFYADSGGLNIGTSTTIPVYVTANTNGVYLASNGVAWIASSDERLKTDLINIEDAANKVSSLRSVIGRYKTDEVGTKRPFLIAQDVFKVLPEAVTTDEKTGDLGVSYSEVIPLLVAAIKELKLELDQLKNK